MASSLSSVSSPLVNWLVNNRVPSHHQQASNFARLRHAIGPHHVNKTHHEGPTGSDRHCCTPPELQQRGKRRTRHAAADLPKGTHSSDLQCSGPNCLQAIACQVVFVGAAAIMPSSMERVRFIICGAAHGEDELLDDDLVTEGTGWGELIRGGRGDEGGRSGDCAYWGKVW